MKLMNINKTITDFFGNEVLTVDESGQNKKGLTYKDGMIVALLNSSKQGETDEEKYKKFELAKKISLATDELVIESPEQRLIRTCSAIAWGTLVHGLLVDFVEGKES